MSGWERARRRATKFGGLCGDNCRFLSLVLLGGREGRLGKGAVDEVGRNGTPTTPDERAEFLERPGVRI